MNLTTKHTSFIIIYLSLLMLTLLGCGSSKESEKTGYIQFYNASENSPTLYLSLENSIKKVTPFTVPYSKSSGRYESLEGIYDLDLSWKDDDGQFHSVYQGKITIVPKQIQFLVISGDITSPTITNYPNLEDNPDKEDKKFTLSLLNLSSITQPLSLHYSKSNESFNEAILFRQFNAAELSTNQHIELDTYIFYITLADSNEVLFKSKAIKYAYTTQYIMVVRNNNGPGSSPFIIDQTSNSKISTSFTHSNSIAQFQVYNGIQQDDLLIDYNGIFDLHFNGIKNSADISSLSSGYFSTPITSNFGDYSIDLTHPNSQDIFAKNHLLTLGPNSDKSVFFYLSKTTKTNSDGDDITSVHINSLVNDNNNNDGKLKHQVQLINLINNFSAVRVYFVRNNETIDTAALSSSLSFAQSDTLSLLNNTYSVYVIGYKNNTDLILASAGIVVDEQSKNQYIILETDDLSASGYKITFLQQRIKS